MTSWDLAFWAAGGTIALAGLLLCAWSLLHDRPRGRRRCPRCWYDMSAVPGLKCPECGREVRTERRLLRTRRRWRRAALAALLVILGGAAAILPAVRSGKWVKYPPVWSFHAVLTFFDGDAEAAYDTLVASVSPAPTPTGITARQGTGIALDADASSIIDASLFPRLAALNTPAPPTNPTLWRQLLVARRCAVLLRAAAEAPGSADPGVDWARGPAITVGTQATSSTVREVIGIAVGLGPESRLVMPAVLRLLHARDPRVQAVAADAILALDLDVKVLLPLFTDLVEHSTSDEARERAARALYLMGRPAVSARPALARVLARDRAGDVRAMAAFALQAIDPANPASIAPLAAAVDDPQPCVRVAAARAMARLALAGPDGPGATPPAPADARIIDALCRLLADSDRSVRMAAASALRDAGDERALPPLIARWDSEPDPDVRWALVMAMKRARAGDWLLPYFIELLHAQSDDGALWAVQAIWDLGPAGAPAATAVQEAIDNRRPLERLKERAQLLGPPAREPPP